jgi:hypothetical protein
MGLAERRAAKQFETSQFPQLKKKIDEAAHFEVPVEVKWETLATEGSSHLYEECWPKVYFKPLADAFSAICIDDMGRDALKGSLKKVIIQNTQDVSYSSYMVSFVDGVLTLDHLPTTNVDDVDDRKKAIQTKLESAL